MFGALTRVGWDSWVHDGILAPSTYRLWLNWVEAFTHVIGATFTTVWIDSEVVHTLIAFILLSEDVKMLEGYTNNDGEKKETLVMITITQTLPMQIPNPIRFPKQKYLSRYPSIL